MEPVGQQVDQEAAHGRNGSFCAGQPQALSSWWSYNSPILAAAPGVVVAVMDGLPDQEPVGTITNLTAANSNGNSVIEDIGSLDALHQTIRRGGVANVIGAGGSLLIAAVFARPCPCP